MPRIEGEFEIIRALQPNLDLGGGLEAMHVRFEKRFHGPLDATSVVQMMGFMTATEGSGAYVAIERIAGILDGHEGAFVVHHTGRMDRGEPQLRIGVVPDSGTEGLAGLRGEMTIEIVEGRHRYTFEYELAN
ncbi:MAG: DUF3224 domain-containing protein [Xanthomonadaceae bacterium]|nr:DUF3224 domain-containing protein [Xanthomonadaceae bacterium]